MKAITIWILPPNASYVLRPMWVVRYVHHHHPARSAMWAITFILTRCVTVVIWIVVVWSATLVLFV